MLLVYSPTNTKLQDSSLENYLILTLQIVHRFTSTTDVKPIISDLDFLLTLDSLGDSNLDTRLLFQVSYGGLRQVVDLQSL